MSADSPTSPMAAVEVNGLLRARRVVPADKVERRLWVQIGDDRRMRRNGRDAPIAAIGLTASHGIREPRRRIPSHRRLDAVLLDVHEIRRHAAVLALRAG